jgi:hypothetical protein
VYQPKLHFQDLDPSSTHQSTLQQTILNLLIRWQVKLEEPNTFAVGLCDILDRLRGSGGQAITKVQLLGYGSCVEFSALEDDGSR